MNRYFVAIRKDFILVKKFLPSLLGILLIFSAFMNSQLNVPIKDYLIFLLIEIFGVQLLFNYLSQLEDGEFGRNALIASPYGRKLYITSRYLFIAISFALIYVVYCVGSVLTKILNYYPYNLPDIHAVVMVMFVLSLWITINLLVYYRFGYAKMRIFSTIVMFLLPFAISIAVKEYSFNFNFLSLEQGTTFAILVILSILIYLVSMFVSIKLFEKRDL